MPFIFDEDQRELAEGVHELLADHATGARARAVASGQESWRDLWRRIADLGVTAMAIPASHGGLGLSPVELTAVCEVAGRFLLPAPLVATAGGFVPAAAEAGGEAAQCLATIARHGEAATLCFADPRTGPAATLAGGRISVEGLLVPDAARVDHLGLMAEREDGRRAFAVVPASAARISEVGSLDRTRPLARVSLEGVEAAVSEVAAHVCPLLVGFVTAAAELVGIAAEMLQTSVRYAGEREQFGAKIGSFQAIKHRLVDGLLALERARSLTYRAAVLAAGAKAAADAQALRAAHMAKAAASEAATEIARCAVQVHGGIGITAEHDVSLFYLRARQASMMLGDRDHHYLAATRD